MADPIITFHDAAGDPIPEGTAQVMPTATPGTPGFPLLLSVRNNDAAGPAVDPLRNGRLTLLGRLQGSSDEPGVDLTYVAQGALEAKVVSVSGDATTTLRGFTPVGPSSTIPLSTIPDGGTVNLEVRTSATLAATLTAVTLQLTAEGIQSTALADGSFEATGNFVYDGATGGVPDPTFSQVFSKAGALDPGAFDDTVDTWTSVIYTRAGVSETTTPSPPTKTYNNLDGAAAALVLNEAYWVDLSLDGSDTIVDTKGLKAIEAAAIKPQTPVGNFHAGYVLVPFGLAIDTVEDDLTLGFFDVSVVSGLTIRVAGGQGLVANRFVDDETSTDILLADDSTLTLYRRSEGGLEVVAFGTSPADPRSMRLYEITTVAGVTALTDRRRIGTQSLAGVPQKVAFIVDGAAADLQVVHVTLLDGLGQIVLDDNLVEYFVSGSADGVGITTDTITDLTVGPSPQSITIIGSNVIGFLGTDETGHVDVTFDETTGPSAQTFYLVVQIDFTHFVSTAIIPKP